MRRAARYRSSRTREPINSPKRNMREDVDRSDGASRSRRPMIAQDSQALKQEMATMTLIDGAIDNKLTRVGFRSSRLENALAT